MKLELVKRSTGFTERTTSKNAVIAFFLGITMIVLHIILFVMAIVKQGTLPYMAGTLESFLMLFGIFGFFWGILSYDDEKTTSKYKLPAVILNGISLVFSISVMIWGFGTYM